MKEVDVQIRRARGVEDYQKIVELEKQVWGYADPADLAAVPILMIANRFGGAVLVAEGPAQRLIGFAMANLGRGSQEKLFWGWNMPAGAQEFKTGGAGLRLSFRKAEKGLVGGSNRFNWQFDPLKALTAIFNFPNL